ncbi:MAG: NUDIX domain-containing protein [Actinomycetota bacterium]|nr:MAG: NUDIX domain-containing protein [Actinomycetota bacterium]
MAEEAPAERVEALVALLAGHRPADQREADSLAVIRRELVRLPRPFDEHADPTHVTGSAIVVGRRGVVLHLHKRFGTWMQPGGHVEPGEDVWEAALRETIEETGLLVCHPLDGPLLVHVDVHLAPRGHNHLDVCFLLEAGDANPCPPPGESPDVRWLPWDVAASVADVALRTALTSARALSGG